MGRRRRIDYNKLFCFDICLFIYLFIYFIHNKGLYNFHQNIKKYDLQHKNEYLCTELFRRYPRRRQYAMNSNDNNIHFTEFLTIHRHFIWQPLQSSVSKSVLNALLHSVLLLIIHFWQYSNAFIMSYTFFILYYFYQATLKSI
jgi:hypothetical protein